MQYFLKLHFLGVEKDISPAVKLYMCDDLAIPIDKTIYAWVVNELFLRIHFVEVCHFPFSLTHDNLKFQLNLRLLSN